jgi:hypothetical protein
LSEEDKSMKTLSQIGILMTVVFLCTSTAVAGGKDPRASLEPQNITRARINLNPGGAQLGFEVEVDGDDPRVETLVAVIREAEPCGGHKCPNQGAIRFWLADGSVLGVGLLPSHTQGRYEFRLYVGDRYLSAYRVERASLLSALEQLGVPTSDPAFRE